jgi:hypothetical protein
MTFAANADRACTPEGLLAADPRPCPHDSVLRRSRQSSGG